MTASPFPPGYLPAETMLWQMFNRGLTDSEVARLTGVSQSTITRIRQGTQKKASADLYFRICAVFRSRFPVPEVSETAHD